MHPKKRKRLFDEHRASLMEQYDGFDRQFLLRELESDDHVIASLTGIWDAHHAVVRARKERIRVRDAEARRLRQKELEEERERDLQRQEVQRQQEAADRHNREIERLRLEEAERQVAAARLKQQQESRDAEVLRYRESLAERYGDELAADAWRFFRLDDVIRYDKGGILGDMISLRRREA